MKIAILCWRPYHVFSAINIVKNNIENSAGNTTLFLYDYANLMELKSGLEESGLFNKVIIINDYKPNAQRLQKIVGLIFSRSAIRHHIIGVTDISKKDLLEYDRIISTSCNIIFYEFVHANPEVPIIFFEDGTLAYVSDEIEHALNNPRNRYIKKLIEWSIRKSKVKAKYVYEPKLVTATGYPLKKLDKIRDDVDDIQRTIFSYNQQTSRSLYKGKRIIYLDERYPSEYFKDTISEEAVFDILNEHYEETILRPHPGNEPGTTIFDVDTEMQSWELTCRDILSEDTILITKTSTAAFTPFLLYGIKANIIFLANLLFKKTEGEERIAISLEKDLMYKNIYMPKSLDEFKSTLSKLYG